MLFRKKAEKISPQKEEKAKPVKKAPAAKAAPKAEKAPAKKVEAKPAAKKAAAPAKAEKASAKEATRVYHVAKREDGKWQVKFAGGDKAIKLFDTQKEAIEFTKVMASNQEGKMLVHNSKGQNKGKIKSK